MHKESIFFTKNGALLENLEAVRPTHYSFTGVTGRLYPAIGTTVPGVKVKVNFGNNPSKPFVWAPGNDADSGIARVGEMEEALAGKPLLRRRTTTAVNEANVVSGAGDEEVTTAGAEVLAVGEGQRVSIGAAA